MGLRLIESQRLTTVRAQSKRVIIIKLLYDVLRVLFLSSTMCGVVRNYDLFSVFDCAIFMIDIFLGQMIDKVEVNLSSEYLINSLRYSNDLYSLFIVLEDNIEIFV